MDENIFSIAEAAKYIGVSPLTLRNWENKRLIKSFRTPGGHRRFRKSELDRIIGINGTGSKLEKAIMELEEIDIENGKRRAVNQIINDLKNISDKL